MPNELTVSICVPVYNGERFISETLESVVRQTYPHREIIVSDNASTDKTPQIVRNFMRDYPIRHERSDTLLPVSEENFNRCISLARNDLVCIYHSDDVYEPQIVARCVGMMKDHPQVGAVFTTARVINEQGKEISRYRLPNELKKLNKQIFNLGEIFKAVLKNENSFLVCPSVMVRKSVYDRLGGWEYDKYRHASDLGLWFKIAREYPIAILDEPLIRYRVSTSQDSQHLTRQRTDKDCYLRVIEDYMRQTAVEGDERYYQASCIKDQVYRALNLSALGRVNESRELTHQALRNFGRHFKDLYSLGRALFWAGVGILLVGFNALPFAGLRRFYRTAVMKTLGMKKRIIAY